MIPGTNPRVSIPREAGIIIQENEVTIETLSKEGKYGFIISKMEDGNYHPILNSGWDYATPEEAKESGENLVKKIREIDLEF